MLDGVVALELLCEHLVVVALLPCVGVENGYRIVPHIVGDLAVVGKHGKVRVGNTVKGLVADDARIVFSNACT